ncbi:DUF397 domain-containing protein [Actinosynnema sp. NPDC050436]|uniref:DUF397 domain-containing protein n=1 Tax=Actinosynnema sp. NPDC050436 TaxID=3155659 RepID=UPI003405E4D0
MWRKSSRSNGGGNCVEIARSSAVVQVRDSKNAGGPVLGFSAGAAAAFFSSVARVTVDR